MINHRHLTFTRLMINQTWRSWNDRVPPSLNAKNAMAVQNSEAFPRLYLVYSPRDFWKLIIGEIKLQLIIFIYV